MSEVPNKIRELVERFKNNLEIYKSKSYDEADLRQEFLNPFFEMLGWDMDNKAGYSPAYRDVIHEDRSRSFGPSGTPDYSFRIGGMTKFFVEAKRPSANLENDPKWAFQLRRYGWNAKLPICILTNFEEFCVYDCRIPLSPKDKAFTARIASISMHFSDYVERWDEIVNIFSREAILKGSFDKFATGKHKKLAMKQVDAKFLEDMELWREKLAKEIHKNHHELSSDELNFAVQHTIDRIVFLRMCEDRGIEKVAQLQGLMAGPRIYQRMWEIFLRADKKYNSGLFHFTKEKDREGAPDTLTGQLEIGDKVLREILSTLYDDKSYSVYDFSIMPPEILGHVYEQFLGKTVRLTPKRVYIEEKPAVRKAGGVYYTPRYISEYIVKQTVGSLCKGKDAASLSKIRIVDPSCGSGSFLLTALQYLYNIHLQLYVEELKKTGKIPASPPPEGKRRKKSDPPAIYKGKGDDWQLTTAEKRRILLNNIYGVDIDRQAVEVTKLSLSLTVLENENEDSLLGQLQGWAERALPDLGNNIKCGNSLIGPDFYRNTQLDLLDNGTEKRINIFDWKAAFPSVFSGNNPGFDAVIGNPPYIRIQHMKEWAPVEVEFYKKRYRSARQGNYDIYVVFVEHGLTLLSAGGVLGYILPHKFFNAKYGEGLRGLLAEGRYLDKVVHFGDQQIFEGATNYTCLLFLSTNAAKNIEYMKVTDLDAWRTDGACEQGKIKTSEIKSSEWNFDVGNGSALMERLRLMPTKLGDICTRIFQGLVTGKDPVFLVQNKGKDTVFSEATSQVHKIEKALLHPLCKGSVNLRRYNISDITQSIIFPYKIANGKAELIPPSILSRQFPNAWKYLIQNRDLLESRERGKWKNDRWYAFGRSQNLSEMEQVKIMTPSLAQRGSFSIDSSSEFYFVGSGGGGGGGYGIVLDDAYGLSYEYVLGLLNSKLLDFFIKQNSTPFRGGYYAYNRQYIEQCPIRTINKTEKNEKSLHDRVVVLVERMLDLNKQLPEAKTENEKERLERRISATDQEIDHIVYELYGLTDDEISIVEGETRK